VTCPASAGLFFAGIRLEVSGTGKQRTGASPEARRGAGCVPACYEMQCVTGGLLAVVATYTLPVSSPIASIPADPPLVVDI
jgi:hypothetical protein